MKFYAEACYMACFRFILNLSRGFRDSIDLCREGIMMERLYMKFVSNVVLELSMKESDKSCARLLLLM